MSKSTLLTPQSKESLREEIDKLLSEISILQGIYSDPEDENNNKTKPKIKPTTSTAVQWEYKQKSKLEFRRSKPKVSTVTLPSDYNQKRPQSPLHPQAEAKPEDESLKSPYLRCLMDVLKIDGHNQFELAKSQQEIMKQFQLMSGMHRPSTPPTKESIEADYSNFASQTNKNGRPTTARSNADFLRAQALAELKRPTPSQAKIVVPKAKPERTVLPKKTAKKSPSTIQTFVNAPQLLSSLSSYAPHPQKPFVLDSEDLTFVFGAEPKNERKYSEEIKHYYNWKAFCLVKRYGNNPEKLKEKLKTMEEDFAHLNMDLPVVPPPSATSIGIMEEDENEARKSLSTPPKKVKKKVNKSVQKFDSKKILPLTRPPPKAKAKSQLKDCVTVRKCASHEHKVNRDQHVPRVQSQGICNWNQRMDMAPSWELTGLVKLATVFVPVDEDELFEQQHQNQNNSKSKFKSRFTIRDEKLEKLKLYQ